jgi:4-coumarate--CoA ligase
MIFSQVVVGATILVMEKCEFRAMLRAIEKHRVTSMPAVPSLIVALAKLSHVLQFDLTSIENVGVGGIVIRFINYSDFDIRRIE